MKKALLLLATLGLTTFASAQFSIQNVIIEEFTGAWCGYCPDGALIVDDILATNDNAIAVGVHNSDPMSTTEGDNVDAFYNALGYPGAILNRNTGAASRNTWKATAASITAGSGYVTVSIDSIDYNSLTRVMNVKVNATFTGPLTGDFRMLFWVTEDNVTGGASYNQTNYYNTTVGHPYYGAGDPIVGFSHGHVLRAMPSTEWGVAGLFPATVNFGSSADYTFTYTLPAGYDENEIHLVAGVSNHDGPGVTERRILNGAEALLLTPTAVDPSVAAENAGMFAYPNPFSSRTSIQFTVNDLSNAKIEVLNTMGQHIATLGEGFLAKGTHTMHWSGLSDAGTPVANGVYLIRLTTDKGQTGLVKVMMQN